MDRAQYRAVRRADDAANRGYLKSRVVLRGLRRAQLWRGRRGPLGRVGYLLAATHYKLVAEWLLGVEIPPSTPVGPGLRLRHGIGVVVNPASVIGAGVMIRQNVTIGNRRRDDDCPRIGDRVEIGAGAVIVGDIEIGSGARIGPGAVVIVDVPAGATVFLGGTEVRPPKPRASDAEAAPNPD
ncbi:serine acetyltransferase [Schumannella sp. 10F1B-5-1]|uniref:serine acetyltransferase n=1 Tax=Schumannella sp. 10F1B-5-1 TaxID=2590780 RepID=UPI001130EC7F|nr:serine acetyltransferase [Schumannella sp. 10F1B-5-1]TPW73783.1 serine acetyltransferase [Schumannella sp. 10F1B-5-1]